MWEKEKLLVTSNFSFSHIVFYRFGELTAIFINPFPHNDTFWRLWETSLLKTLWEKEKLLVTSNFSFSRSVFYLFEKLSSIFVKFEIVVCKLFQFGRV